MQTGRKRKTKPIRSRADNYLPVDIKNMPTMAELFDTASVPIKDADRPSVRNSASDIYSNIVSFTSPVDTNNMSTMEQLFCENPSFAKREGEKLCDSTHDIRRNTDNQLSTPPAIAVDLGTMTSMDDLLGEAIDKPLKQEQLHGTVLSKHRDNLAIQVESFGRAHVNCGSVKIPESVEVGDRVVVTLSTDPDDGGFVDLTVVKILKSKTRRQRKRPRRGHHLLPEFNGIVVDGSNVCRSFSRLTDCSSITPLLALICHLIGSEIACRCIFDANERYMLRKNDSEPNGERIYEMLLQEFSAIFTEVPAASNADDYILNIADRDDWLVISNDRFDKAEDGHLEQYPWLIGNRKRLVPGFVEDRSILVDGLELNIPLRADLSKLISELRNHLSD